jgi:hypothetical protein
MILRAIRGMFTTPARSTPAKSVRRPLRPKLTGFEALEERYLLSHCVAPQGEPPDQAAVDAYNACLADETNSQTGDNQNQAEGTITGGGTGTDGDQSGDVTQQNLTFAGGSGAGDDTFTLFSDSTGDGFAFGGNAGDGGDLAVSGFSFDSAGTLTISLANYSAPGESDAGSQSGTNDSSGYTGGDMGSTGGDASTGDSGTTGTGGAAFPSASFTIDTSDCGSSSSHIANSSTKSHAWPP